MGEVAVRIGNSDTPAGLDLEVFSSIIGAIYECTLEPQLWPKVLSQVCRAVGGSAGWIAIHEPRRVRSVYQVEAGTDPEWQRRLREEFVAISPFIVATHHFRAGDVFSVDDVVDYDEFLQGRFYREWAAPQGWPDNVLGVLTKDSERFAWLGVCMAERATAENKVRASAFLPHLSRALRISDLLDYRAAEAADLVAAVESLPTGMILLDDQGAIRGSNPAAEQLMRESGVLSAPLGRLRASGEGGAALLAAIETCAEHGGQSVLLPSADGGVTLLANVVPLPRARPGQGGHAVAAVLLNRPAEPAPGPVEAVVKHYGLTPSETRVLLAMLNGQTPRDIAEANGVAMPTIRTHLSRLYGKTGVRGQAGLVGLVTRMSA